MNGIPTEPSADIRQAANAMRQLFVALEAEGFTEAQALKLVAQMLTQHRPGGESA